MKTGNHQYKFKNGILAYSRKGQGEQVLLLFHGYGQDKSAFDLLVGHLQGRFIIYSFDLFFHGHSKWHLGDRPISKNEWTSIFTGFIQQEQITKFSLIGFSLGAKPMLAILEAFQSSINAVYLIAPEGIKPNIWYQLATSPVGFKKLFKSLIQNPNRLKLITRVANSMRLIDTRTLKLVSTQMQNEKQRSRVYYSWMVFSQLNFNTSTIAGILKGSDIETILILGSKDKIISAHDLKRLTDQVPNIRLEILEAEHQSLIHKSIRILKKIK